MKTLKQEKLEWKSRNNKIRTIIVKENFTKTVLLSASYSAPLCLKSFGEGGVQLVDEVPQRKASTSF